MCPHCSGLIEIVNRVENFSGELEGRGLWRYARLIPGTYPKIISLGEGGTPLIVSRDYGNLYLKFEGANPTGSFKDRGMSVAVSIAASLGYRGVIAASTGNTAASASAYSARAGLASYVVLPAAGVALGKVAQSIFHGSKVIELDGNFDEVLSQVISVFERASFYPLNSFNPWRLEGQKTLAYEVCEELGSPDYMFVPVGNGGNIYAIWKGFVELREAGVIGHIPRMVGVQASGASPIAHAVQAGLDVPRFVEKPETFASAIRIGKPVNWRRAIKAITHSGGFALAVTDREIRDAQYALARREGIGAEPASAASFAGYSLALSRSLIAPDAKTVCVLTGHALKDPDALLAQGSTVKAGKRDLERLLA